MNVAENLFINRHPQSGLLIDKRKLFKQTSEYLEKFVTIQEVFAS